MILYERALLSLNQTELKRFACDLAKKLFPRAGQRDWNCDSGPAATLAREIKRQIPGESAPSSAFPTQPSGILSTPELIALTRLGMELRCRRLSR